MKRRLLTAIFIGIGISGVSQNLAVSNIDPSLTQKANVVIRNAVHEFTVINKGKAIESYHLELTILNEAGKDEAIQHVMYSDLESVLEVSGEIYDRSGIRVKKIKKSAIEDMSATGSNMYSDNRIKILDFTYPSYPYSIVFSYKVAYDGLMFYPSWDPQNSYWTAIEKSKFIVKVPDAVGLNFYEYQVKGSQKKESSVLIYEWEVRNLTGLASEPYGPPGRDLSPYVLVTPKHFKMEGYEGSMSSWKEIGDWANQLSEGCDDLPDGAKTDINKLLVGVSDKREKTKLIYEYVQNTTRYVSVQLGIGGWKPFNASYVYENGYGDCKALTNYTSSMLNYAGIESIYTLVKAGGDVADIVTEFPNAHFNHVFLAVPIESDTVWLECTSQTTPFGYLGTFTSDRHALMVTRDGGKLVKTPTYSEEDNLQIRVAKVEIGKNGDAVAQIKTEYSGIQYENVRRQLSASTTEQKNWLLKNVNLDKTKITNFSYNLQPGVQPKVVEQIDVTSIGFGDVTGNRIFFEVNPLNQLTSIPKKLKERKTKVHIEMAYTDVDSIHYTLPEGYHVEYLPESKTIETEFANYSTSYTLTENGIVYVRKMVRWQGVYPAASYNKFRQMLKDISRSDKTKIVLVGST
jgi:Domain of Unknown Function with PDB structure (DUF3857)